MFEEKCETLRGESRAEQDAEQGASTQIHILKKKKYHNSWHASWEKKTKKQNHVSNQQTNRCMCRLRMIALSALGLFERPGHKPRTVIALGARRITVPNFRGGNRGCGNGPTRFGVFCFGSLWGGVHRGCSRHTCVTNHPSPWHTTGMRNSVA
jgi:hypothetical protein